MGLESMRHPLEDCLKMIEDNEAEIEIMNNSDRAVGAVYATSGYRSTRSQDRDWTLDWSLTKVLPERVLQNTVEADASKA